MKIKEYWFRFLRCLKKIDTLIQLLIMIAIAVTAIYTQSSVRETKNMINLQSEFNEIQSKFTKANFRPYVYVQNFKLDPSIDEKEIVISVDLCHSGLSPAFDINLIQGTHFIEDYPVDLIKLSLGKEGLKHILFPGQTPLPLTIDPLKIENILIRDVKIKSFEHFKEELLKSFYYLHIYIEYSDLMKVSYEYRTSIAIRYFKGDWIFYPIYHSTERIEM